MNSTIRDWVVMGAGGLWSLCLMLAVDTGQAGEVMKQQDAQTGWEIYTLTQNTTTVRVAPATGANLFSLRVDGNEYFRQPEALDKLPNGGYGNPVLYPTPNRVRDARFSFRGRTFNFPPNSGKNFIHGLVRGAKWDVVKTHASENQASITCAIVFQSRTEWYERFPLAHELQLTMTVTDRKVRWEYLVDNRTGTAPVPFGFALHPYFVYQGNREDTYLTIPASHWMESEKQLPSGKLVPAKDLSYPLRSPMSLAGTTFDDVFYGLKSAEPTLIDFRGAKRKITLHASDDFTHLVVWTPNQPHFGIESQTCSTDAHNLSAQGLTEAAHLQVCEPGSSLQGWVEYQFAKE